MITNAVVQVLKVLDDNQRVHFQHLLQIESAILVHIVNKPLFIYYFTNVFLNIRYIVAEVQINEKL